MIDWINQPDWEEKRRFTHQHAADLLTDDAEEVFASLLQRFPAQSSTLKVHRILLRSCRQIGIDPGFDLQIRRASPVYTDTLAVLLTQWLVCPTWAESKAFLEAHTDDLLNEWAEYCAENAARASGNDPRFMLQLNLIGRCLAVGTDRAYAEFRHYWQE